MALRNSALSALLYILIGCLYILLSDTWLFGKLTGVESAGEVSYRSILKGMAFMLVSGVLLFFLLRKLLADAYRWTYQYKLVFDNQFIPMWVTDCEDFSILEVNQAAVNAYGYNRREFLTLNMADLLGPDQQGIFLSKTAASKEPHGLDGEWVHRDVSGRLFRVNMNTFPLDFKKRRARLIQVEVTEERLKAREELERTNTELKLQKASLKHLLDAQLIYLIRVDAEGKLTYANRAFCQAFDLKSKEIAGADFSDLLSEETSKELKATMTLANQQPGTPFHIQLRKRDRLEGNYYTLWEFIALTNPVTNALEFQGTGHDISNQERLREQLLEQADKLRQVFNNIYDVIWEWDEEAGEYSLVSEAAQSIYGYTSAEIIEHPHLLEELVLDEDRAIFTSRTERLKKSGYTQLEYRIVNRAGETRWILERVSRETRQGRNYLQGVATDITHIKAIQQQRMELFNKLSLLFQGLVEGFLLLDANRIIRDINPSFGDLFELQPSKWVNKPLMNIPELTSQKSVMDLLDWAERDQRDFHLEHFFENIGKWIRIDVYPVKQGFGLFFLDITQEKHFMSALQDEEAKLRAIVNNTMDFIWSVDADLRITSANESYTQFIRGRQRGEVTGKNVISLLRSEKEKEAWAERYAQALQGNTVLITEEVELNGQPAYFEFSFNPILGNEGTVRGVGCFGRNITQQKKAEMQIKEQHERLLEISWIQSHRIRGPLASIMGLVSFVKNHEEEKHLHGELLDMLLEAARQLDEVVHEVVKASEGERI